MAFYSTIKVLIFSIIVGSFSCNNFKGNIKNANMIPIIYSNNYNIKLFGIQKLHPFDTEKPEKIYKHLTSKFDYRNDQFYKPIQVTDSQLLEIHTKEYLNSLNKSNKIAEIAELHALRFLPSGILKRKLLKPMKYATGGTILGTDVAIKHSFAINLSGGYHHAKANSGEGFCFFADINLAVSHLKEKHKINSIMIIDLDAHQGNGHESIVKNDSNVFIFDIYNKDVYPDDKDVKQYIDYHFPISKYTKDTEYLSIIEKELPKAIKESKPDFIIYNAGTDIYEGDLLGMLSVSEKGIIERDDIVFKNAIDSNIPILMLLSGGYSKKSAEITAKSIENIIIKHLR